MNDIVAAAGGERIAEIGADLDDGDIIGLCADHFRHGTEQLHADKERVADAVLIFLILDILAVNDVGIALERRHQGIFICDIAEIGVEAAVDAFQIEAGR